MNRARTVEYDFRDTEAITIRDEPMGFPDWLFGRTCAVLSAVGSVAMIVSVAFAAIHFLDGDITFALSSLGTAVGALLICTVSLALAIMDAVNETPVQPADDHPITRTGGPDAGWQRGGHPATDRDAA